MKTRAEVSQEWDIHPNGFILNPGRFEGEEWWIVNVEEWDMDGDGEQLVGLDESDEYVALFSVADLTPEERAEMEIGDDTAYVSYRVSDSGFRSVSEMTEGEAERERAWYAEQTEGPTDGDYIVGPTGYLGGKFAVWIEGETLNVGTFTTFREAVRAIQSRMDAESFYPDVWEVSDHGNVRRVELEEPADGEG